MILGSTAAPKFLAAALVLACAACGSGREGWQGRIETEGEVTVVRNPGEPMYTEPVLTLEDDLVIRGDEEFKGLELGDAQTAPVKEVMSERVHCIEPDRSAAVAAAKMVEQRIHRLVVVDESGRVLGIISALDILRAMPGVGQ